ncbi:hypothetical protein RXV86_20655 [Alisedimentitalea sp. MJ-SS2]|uniref:hypothetical protein n=1 Tax=Aliisedimentitalea sp. MJ-SS2 TaxID=3049795 RepID=UPI00290D8762|nr:hypothetical protein [Alisedimentitalea sp. MJ-SS2]MDU8929805.1 hypothetical protein [Alisedimentitalea sp. MJ-SS2]
MNWTPLKALIATQIAVQSVVLGLSGAAIAQQPLSAIEWLNNPLPVTSRVGPMAVPGGETVGQEPDVTESAVSPDVSVRTLDEAGRDAVGLLPASVTGLPSTLWQNSQSGDLVRALRGQDVLGMPAMQSLLYTLLLAEAEPPHDAGVGHLMLAARIGKLWELGAVEPAQALIERAGPDTPALFKLWFDLALMSGTEEEACNRLNAHPHLSADTASRVYCLARGGDWNAAAVMLDTGRVLGLMRPSEEQLISLFIDPELIEELGDPAPPADVTPLLFRLSEAAGVPMATAPLPRAYAMADLRDTSGWKAELEAAERLSRTGALSENRLIDVYTARHPAASGGIWDRVEALQRFDIAMKSGDPGAVAVTLPAAWKAMQEAHLEVPFARFYAKGLARLPLAGDAHVLALTVGLLSPDYETIASKMRLENDEERFLAALARGVPQEAITRDPLGRVISRAFGDSMVPTALEGLLAEGKLGEAILKTMSLFSSGVAGNLADIEAALRGFRAIGLEDTARRAALQLMLLNQGG